MQFQFTDAARVSFHPTVQYIPRGLQVIIDYLMYLIFLWENKYVRISRA